MIDEYDAVTAYHYRAYRPPLHGRILAECIENKGKYPKGLDIGSGTGHSSLALTPYCNMVAGVEPSLVMRQKALKHAQVEYFDYDKNRLPFDDATFDLITLAGSLYYGKSQRLLDEIVRVGTKDGSVILYDFELLLDEALHELDLKNLGESSYNHQEDFSGLSEQKLSQIRAGSNEMEVNMGANDLAHILLSIKTFYLYLVDLHRKERLHEKIASLLRPIVGREGFTTKAQTYYKVYRIVK
ncbi:class I SAM-dependent methyltransferase [Maribacter algicola]|uniref:Class I SAM-dependent methyltransferase n=1 Tax=Meishania litoralis TaxID=3434685 RepID=A0ACC7LS66_9FLAO